MKTIRTTPLLISAIAIAFALGAAAQAAEREVIELIPADRSSWGATNVFAPVTGLFMGGPGYWYGAREIEIDTTPSGAVLDLFYVRANFQKRFEQAESPILLRLPSRIEAGPRDSITIRSCAFSITPAMSTRRTSLWNTSKARPSTSCWILSELISAIRLRQTKLEIMSRQPPNTSLASWRHHLRGGMYRSLVLWPRLGMRSNMLTGGRLFTVMSSRPIFFSLVMENLA